MTACANKHCVLGREGKKYGMSVLALVCHLCRALQRVEEAITQYLLRIKLGGWVEERFMSALNIADLSKKHWEAGKLISSQVRSRWCSCTCPRNYAYSSRLWALQSDTAGS
jgi:hypothetical protein